MPSLCVEAIQLSPKAVAFSAVAGFASSTSDHVPGLLRVWNVRIEQESEQIKDMQPDLTSRPPP